jgi:Uma2 family endonuclease
MAAKSKQSQSTFLGPWSNGTRMSPSEYEAGDYERGPRYELRHGMLVVTDQLSAGESDACEQIGYLVRKDCDPERTRESLVTLPGSIVRIGEDRLIPDRVIWLVQGRRPGRFETPTIAIEFDSLRRRLTRTDQDARRTAYFSAGVNEYWIVDRFTDNLVQHVNRDGRTATRKLGLDSVLRTRLLPGFELHVGDLIARTHDLENYEHGENERDWTASSRY